MTPDILDDELMHLRQLIHEGKFGEAWQRHGPVFTFRVITWLYAFSLINDQQRKDAEQYLMASEGPPVGFNLKRALKHVRRDFTWLVSRFIEQGRITPEDASYPSGTSIIRQ